MKLKALVMSSLLAVSAISMVSCDDDAKKPSAGTYTYSGITRSSGKIKIDKDDNVTFERVWMGAEGYASGATDVTNVRVYDQGVYYWAAKVHCHTMPDYDPEYVVSQDALASKDGRTITIALASYKK